MIKGLLRSLLSSKWGFLTGAVLFLGFAFFVNQWQTQIEAAKARAIKEYRIDLDISRHKAEHLSKYQNLVENFKLPSAKALHQNDWIQFAQTMAQDEKLSLRELKPVYPAGKKSSKTPDILLVLEGAAADILRFLYKIAEADDPVYVEKFLLSSVAEQAETVRAQMTLSQVEGR